MSLPTMPGKSRSASVFPVPAPISEDHRFSELRLVSRGNSENVRAKWEYSWLWEKESERNGSHRKGKLQKHATDLIPVALHPAFLDQDKRQKLFFLIGSSFLRLKEQPLVKD